jgi:hypothetical protein
MTRAVSYALHGRLRDAWRYNPRVVFVVPLLVIDWLRLHLMGRDPVLDALVNRP